MCVQHVASLQTGQISPSEVDGNDAFLNLQLYRYWSQRLGHPT